MSFPFTTDDILFAITIGGVAFAIYRSYRDPQNASERVDAVLKEQVCGLRSSLDKVTTNHLPHIDAKIDAIQAQIAEQDKSIVKLATIIDERIPRK